MLLRIAGYADVELRPRILDGRAVGKETLVETLHLTNQVRRVTVSAWRRRKHAILLSLVAAKQQQVGDTQELQVQQLVFDILYRSAATYHVWLHGYPEALLDGSCHSNSARAQAHSLTLKASVAQLFVNKLAMMRGDIDESGIQFAQLFNVGKQPLCARPLQRGQHLKRELVLVVVLGYQVCYGHNRMQRYEEMRKIPNLSGYFRMRS